MNDDKVRKKEIVKDLLKEDFKTDDEEELIEMLIDEPIAIDIDKLEDEKRTFWDKLADMVAATVGSWPFILLLFFFYSFGCF